MSEKDSLALILPAAGVSRRFGGPRNKLLENLADKPVLAWTLDAFLRRDDVAMVILATQTPLEELAQFHPELKRLLSDRRVRQAPGGTSRAHSVQNALAAVDRSIPWVAVHDGARPLISQGLIESTFAAARQYGAAAPALAVQQTIKQARAPLPAKVRQTLDRADLWAMQTPQIMSRQALADAFAHCLLPLEQVTDDVQLLELSGRDVWLVDGDEKNLKITTRLDLHLAHWLIQ